MKTLVRIVITILSAVVATSVWADNAHDNDNYGKTADVSDVVLIYAGNSRRNSWNKEQLTPYVTHKYADGSEKWLFDTFLFLEYMRIIDNNGTTTTYGMGNGMGGDKPASQQDWQWILDTYITNPSITNPKTQDPTMFAALDELIEEKKDTLGAPTFRHKVIVVCPAPKKDGNQWSSESWGTIEGNTIALDTEDNRLTAVKWYIDQLTDRWAKAGYRNIDLEGIYWIEESMISNAGIIAAVNDYARSKGLHSYWIPYYRDGNEAICQRWQNDFKFDMAFFQPNYAFKKADGSTFDMSQLYRTCQGARQCGARLELEFETSGASNALHSADAALHQRINDYMDVYTARGVFDNAPVAYYVGSRGLNDMDRSTDPVDHATMDRLASIVEARRGTTIDRDTDTITYHATVGNDDLQIIFRKCMANDLFTFYQVYLNGKLVNSAEHSDNIGPFLLRDYGWAGGNHLSDNGRKTAKTTDVRATVDGIELIDGTVNGKVLDIDVTNELYMPDGSVFAIEKIKYRVSGNNIDVFAEHDYQIGHDITVDRYYGMQSMFEGETEILVPGAKGYDKWTPVTPDGANNAIKIKKSDAPGLDVFVERSPNGYQTTYMSPVSLGNRDMVDDDDVVFIGNSYGKCYHKLMGNATVKPGMTTKWHGIYSWYSDPDTNNTVTAK